MHDYKDMILEIEKQGKMEAVIKGIEEAIVLSCNEMKQMGKDKKLFFIGCGDSYFGGLAIHSFLSSSSNCLAFPMTALEFAKYGINLIDETSTVIAVSMSGNVARTIEGVLAAQEKGAYVVGITNSENGRLYSLAKHPVLLGLEEEPGWTPGTLTYCGTLYALYRVAAEMANEDKRETCVNRLKHTMGMLCNVFENCMQTSIAAGENLYYTKHTFPLYALGSGPSFATAKYGAAKFLEVCAVVAIGQESEEFAHQEFWVIDKNCPVFIVAPKGPGFERTKEVAHCLRTFGCDLFIISNDEQLCQLGKYCFIMPDDITEAFSPLAYSIPMQLTAYYFSKKQGLDPDRRSHNDPFRKKISRMLTRGTLTLD